MNNFVVYKSSAGSGKTFTLVREYLRLALHDEKKLGLNYRRILAITFTNKAATEMKNRVIETLRQIAQQEDMPFTGQLLSDTLNISQGELKQRATFLLSHILHHYSDFSIGTIDSFTHKIVKTFAHDLKLPVNFNIELDTQGFYEKVIATLFNQIGEDEYVSRLLKEYALSQAQENAAWDPEKQIQEFSKLLQKEHSGVYTEQLRRFSAGELEAFRQQFIDFTKHYKSRLSSEAEKALELIRRHKLEDQDFHYKASGPQNFFKKCKDHSVTLEHTEKGRIIDAINQGKWASESSPNKAVVEAIVPELNTLAGGLLDFIRENYRYFALCELLSKQMYPLMLLKKIEEISLEQKQDERLVFISEFNQKISEIIHNEPTPFIYERLGERYQHYLIDEFQDTSTLQWHNILPLLDNSLSNGWFNLIVGDGKQSIYRWRNANVQQFATLPEVANPNNNAITAGRSQALARNFSGEVLNTNFRSLKTIVEFNNRVFAYLSSSLLSEEAAAIYKDQEQLVRNSGTGYVSVRGGLTPRENLDRLNQSSVRDHILQALESGFLYKDICILVRKNAHGNRIANYLVEQKIPVVSSDSLLLRNNLEVHTVICYLSYLVNRQDHISAGAVVNYLFQSQRIDEAAFHRLLSDLSGGVSLFHILRGCGIDLPEEALNLNNLFDNCISIIRALELDRNGYQYIRFFLDEVNEFLVLKNSNLPAFFDWWQSRSRRASVIIPENTNAVRIMTIHASKGLEFPVVILPYCNWPVYQADDSWVNIENEKVELPVTVIHLSKKVSESGFGKELEAERQEQTLDNLNLLYVAYTRAVERLHIISTVSESNKLISVSDWIRDFIHTQAPGSSPDLYEEGQALDKQSAGASQHLPDFFLEPLRFTTSADAIRIKASYLNHHAPTEEAKRQGLLVHWLLAHIHTAGDIDTALEKGRLEGILDQEEGRELRRKLEEIIAHPGLKEYFREGVSCKLEAELVTQTGDILRPDRIVFQPDKTILLDYKTGRENNTAYFKQLHKYEAALLSMGYPPVKKLLVYVDHMNILEVD